MKALAVILSLSACTPPPIKEGKCRVIKYEKDKAVEQECLFQGFRWHCEGDVCENKGEANAEAKP